MFDKKHFDSVMEPPAHACPVDLLHCGDQCPLRWGWWRCTWWSGWGCSSCPSSSSSSAPSPSRNSNSSTGNYLHHIRQCKNCYCFWITLPEIFVCPHSPVTKEWMLLPYGIWLSKSEGTKFQENQSFRWLAHFSRLIDAEKHLFTKKLRHQALP